MVRIGAESQAGWYLAHSNGRERFSNRKLGVVGPDHHLLYKLEGVGSLVYWGPVGRGGGPTPSSIQLGPERRE